MSSLELLLRQNLLLLLPLWGKFDHHTLLLQIQKASCEKSIRPELLAQVDIK
jgi:hypothetical protein